MHDESRGATNYSQFVRTDKGRLHTGRRPVTKYKRSWVSVEDQREVLEEKSSSI